MAQANVAREPSMEEILASIRKIIESNDPAEEPDMAADETAEHEAPASLAEQPQRPLSLLNQISGETGKTEEAKLPEMTAKIDRPEPLAPLRPGLGQADTNADLSKDTGMAETTSVKAEPEAPPSLANVAAEARGVENSQSDETDISESDLVVLSADELGIDPDDEEEMVAEAQKDAETVADEPRALISPVAGARVAASFGNLNHAVTNGPSRSFDEIAEDMLRPMLQQWMDDNLPTLVERLVREEIERVARGR